MKRESLVSTCDNDRVSIPLPDTLLYYLDPIKRQNKKKKEFEEGPEHPLGT